MFSLEIYKKIADHFIGEMPLMKYCQVILQDIAVFNAVFYKKCSSPDIIYNIPLDQKVMCVMDSNSPVIGLVNCTAFYIRFKL